MQMSSFIADAVRHIRDIVTVAIQHTSDHHALVIYDTQSALAQVLLASYQEVLPEAQYIDFDKTSPDEILAAIHARQPQDLVVLIQSTNFRLNEFRLRIVLFERSLKTIEHLHLSRMTEEQYPTYIESLAYDPSYYRTYGPALKRALDGASSIEVHCPGTVLRYDSAMEPAKLNIGDYREMKNVGGTFPIGEVFTEPKDWAGVNGEVMIFAFAGFDHQVQRHTPFKAIVRDGILDAPDAPPAFQETLAMIRAEERVMVRELGLGLNRAMTKDRIVNDITAYERMKGVHLSLGEKHGVYKKPGLVPGKTRYHVDVFIDVERILVDGRPLFEQGDYLPHFWI